MNISSIQDAEKILATFVGSVKKYEKDGQSLNRMWPILQAVDNPHTKLKVVHIAGTSGKTSTAYYISSLLQKRFETVGLTISPHIDSITERVQINGHNLSDTKFCKYLEEFLQKIDSLKSKPSYFELMIALILWIFVEEGVDYAVLETGLGGLLDGTNVVTRADKVCVITDIGFDHQNILGSSIDQIAAQKAGIMHNGNKVFCFQQGPEVMQALDSHAKEVGAQLEVVKTSDHMQISDNYSKLPHYQLRNLDLARRATDYIFAANNLQTITDDDLLQAAKVVVPARMEEVRINNKKVIMDGAHNRQKTEAFTESFVKKYGRIKVPILLAIKEGKDYKDVLEFLIPNAKKFIFTNFESAQDIPFRSIDPSVLADFCKEKNFANYETIADNKEAYTKLLTSKSEIVIITGSFYLIGQIRKIA